MDNMGKYWARGGAYPNTGAGPLLLCACGLKCRLVSFKPGMSRDWGSIICIICVLCVHDTTAWPQWAWRRKAKKGGDERKKLEQLQARGRMDLCAPAEKGSLRVGGCGVLMTGTFWLISKGCCPQCSFFMWGSDSPQCVRPMPLYLPFWTVKKWRECLRLVGYVFPNASSFIIPALIEIKM